MATMMVLHFWMWENEYTPKRKGVVVDLSTKGKKADPMNCKGITLLPNTAGITLCKTE